MPDMLVKLYTLPDVAPMLVQQRAAGIDIRRAITPEMHIVVGWVREHWSTQWSSECAVAFNRQPPSCFIAVDGDRVVGFACFDTTFRNFFGPTGVLSAYQGRGIGNALLLVCLHTMAAHGYAYAIIGAAGPTEFYTKAVGATVIEDSWPGAYRGLLRSTS